MGGNASSCTVIFMGFHLVSPDPIEGSPYMRFGLLGVVPMGGYMASVLCWLWFLACLKYVHVLFKNPRDTLCWVTQALEAVM